MILNRPQPISELRNHAGEPLLVDCVTAARMLAIGTRKLWSLTNCGEIPCVRLGRCVRYDVEDIRRFIAQNKSGNGSR